MPNRLSDYFPPSPARAAMKAKAVKTKYKIHKSESGEQFEIPIEPKGLNEFESAKWQAQYDQESEPYYNEHDNTIHSGFSHSYKKNKGKYQAIPSKKKK